MAEHAILSFGPGPVNLKASGEDVTVKGSPGSGRPNSCEAKFVPMPAR
jgi:hypothetical protein